MEALANSMMVIILQYINISLNTLNFYNVMCQLYLMEKKKKKRKRKFPGGTFIDWNPIKCRRCRNVMVLKMYPLLFDILHFSKSNFASFLLSVKKRIWQKWCKATSIIRFIKSMTSTLGVSILLSVSITHYWL